jgi:hypothetical protein
VGVKTEIAITINLSSNYQLIKIGKTGDHDRFSRRIRVIHVTIERMSTNEIAIVDELKNQLVSFVSLIRSDLRTGK